VTTYGKLADPADPDAKTIAELYVNCSLQLINFDRPGLAASDTCQQPATSAVELPNGNIMWRCPRHEGMRTLTPGDTGPVHTHLIIRSS
jgi:hypothetical protein